MAASCSLIYRLGACILIGGLPVVAYAVALATTPSGCFTLAPLRWPSPDADTTLFSWTALATVYTWFAVQLLLHVALPGGRKAGKPEPDGTVWTYKLNGFQNFAVTYLIVLGLAFFTDWLPLGWCSDHYLELLTASTIFSIAWACALHVTSFQPGTVVAHGAMTDSAAFNFWMGRPLNPRIGPVDLKEFCELYPGLMAWMILNLAMAHKEYTTTGQDLSLTEEVMDHCADRSAVQAANYLAYKVSLPMLLVNVFQLLYVCDALWSEASILSTMDITTEGFGYMLVFGDLTWVPFVYTIQARYLLHHPQLYAVLCTFLIRGIRHPLAKS